MISCRLAIQHVVIYNTDQPTKEPEKESHACNKKNNRHQYKPSYRHQLVIDVIPAYPQTRQVNPPLCPTPNYYQYCPYRVGKDSATKGYGGGVHFGIVSILILNMYSLD